MKLPGKDATREASHERREIHRLDDDDLHGRNQSISTAVYQKKQEANLKKSTHMIDWQKLKIIALNRIEDGVSDVNPRNCRTEAKDCQLNQRNQL